MLVACLLACLLAGRPKSSPSVGRSSIRNRPENRTPLFCKVFLSFLNSTKGLTVPLNRFVLKFRAGNLSGSSKWRHGGPNGDQKHGKNIKIWGQKFRGQNVCFFRGRPCSWGRSVGFLKARGFAGRLPRRGVFSREKAGPFFIHAKPCILGEGLEKKASRLLQKTTNLRTKSSGARMLIFSGEGLVLGVYLCGS